MKSDNVTIPNNFVIDPDFSRDWLRPVKDAGAADAIARLKSDEASEDYIVIDVPIWRGPPVWDSSLTAEPPPWEQTWPPPTPPEPSFPIVIPTDNQLTGQELMGYLLEGVMDPGNELNELQQFQALRFDESVKPDPAAQRVLDVVDRWVGKLQSEGRTSLTPEEKAQMTTELAEAAKPDPVWITPFPIEPFPIEPWPPLIING